MRLTGTDHQLLLRVARSAIDAHLRSRQLQVRRPASPPLLEQRAAFVTLWQPATPGERLRGCRGEIRATRALIESVAAMAVVAAVDDPRFPPLPLEELAQVRIEISALDPMHPIQAMAVDIERHGLLLRSGDASGLLLPGTPERYGWDHQGFLEALCRKAGVPPETWRSRECELFAFEAEDWAEDPPAATRS